jgi:hypothetical protein
MRPRQSSLVSATHVRDNIGGGAGAGGTKAVSDPAVYVHTLQNTLGNHIGHGQFTTITSGDIDPTCGSHIHYAEIATNSFVLGTVDFQPSGFERCVKFTELHIDLGIGPMKMAVSMQFNGRARVVDYDPFSTIYYVDHPYMDEVFVCMRLNFHTETRHSNCWFGKPPTSIRFKIESVVVICKEPFRDIFLSHPQLQVLHAQPFRDFSNDVYNHCSVVYKFEERTPNYPKYRSTALSQTEDSMFVAYRVAFARPGEDLSQVVCSPSRVSPFDHEDQVSFRWQADRPMDLGGHLSSNFYTVFTDSAPVKSSGAEAGPSEACDMTVIEFHAGTVLHLVAALYDSHTAVQPTDELEAFIELGGHSYRYINDVNKVTGPADGSSSFRLYVHVHTVSDNHLVHAFFTILMDEGSLVIKEVVVKRDHVTPVYPDADLGSSPHQTIEFQHRISDIGVSSPGDQKKKRAPPSPLPSPNPDTIPTTEDGLVA